MEGVPAPASAIGRSTSTVWVPVSTAIYDSGT